MDKISIALWLQDFLQNQDYSLVCLDQSGSERQNYVLKIQKKTYIVTYNSHVAENEAFFYWTQVLQEKQISVAQILKISEDRCLYLQSYLGAQTLAQYMAEHGHDEKCLDYLKKSADLIIKVQKSFAQHTDFDQTLEYKSYNRWAVYNDLFYFKNYFVDYLEIPHKKAQLIAEFEQMALQVEALEAHSLMLRDFQSRNIMVDDNRVAVIDYQSAMRGPIFYDVVSLLYQAKANYPQAWKDEVLSQFIQAWKDDYSIEALHHNFKICQLLRFTQVLGAYGFRGLVQGKAHFISSIPQGIDNLQALAQNWQGINQFPELKKLILGLDKDKINLKINPKTT